jgi:transposase
MAKRRNISSQEKVEIIRKHLLEKVPVSDLADAYGFQPTQFYQWQKQFFENGQAVFERNGKQRNDSQGKRLQDKISQLEGKLAHKDEVIAEIMADHVRLKKSLGED